MCAESERLLDGTLRKIVRGVVTGNRGAVVGQLRVAQFVYFSGAGAVADRYLGGSIGALEQRGAICGDGPRRPLARLVGGGFSPRVANRDGRSADDIRGGIEVAVVQHKNLVRRSCRAHWRAHQNAAFFRVDGDPKRVAVLPVDFV